MCNNKIKATTLSGVISFTYDEYMELMNRFVNLKITSGTNPNKDLIEMTKLNLSRMNRLNKTLIVPNKLVTLIQEISEPQYWIVICEAWCGDCAQNLPALAKLCETTNALVDLKIIFRETNPELMDNYLTGGGKAIPKLIVKDSKVNDLFVWGPRPKSAADIMKNWKANQESISKEDAVREMHSWYANNKCMELFSELEPLISKTIDK